MSLHAAPTMPGTLTMRKTAVSSLRHIPLLFLCNHTPQSKHLVWKRPIVGRLKSQSPAQGADWNQEVQRSAEISRRLTVRRPMAGWWSPAAMSSWTVIQVSIGCPTFLTRFWWCWPSYACNGQTNIWPYSVFHNWLIALFILLQYKYKHLIAFK